jgi:hypothetical protein
MNKKCGKCKTVFARTVIVEFEGRQYNTGNRVYCFECSPPRLRTDSYKNDAIKGDLDKTVELDCSDNRCLECEKLKRIISVLMKELLND